MRRPLVTNGDRLPGQPSAYLLARTVPVAASTAGDAKFSEAISWRVLFCRPPPSIHEGEQLAIGLHHPKPTSRDNAAPCGIAVQSGLLAPVPLSPEGRALRR